MKAARMAAEWWSKRLEQGDKQKFEETLYRRIIDAFSNPDILRDSGEIVIKTDYDPDEILLGALHEAGIECSGYLYSCRGILPMKTLLVVSPTRLYPKEGYANWTAEIPVDSKETI